MSPIIEKRHIILGTTLAVGLVIGWAVGRSGGFRTSDLDPGGTKSSVPSRDTSHLKRHSHPLGSSYSGRIRAELRDAGPAEIPGIMIKTLDQSDPAERMMLMLEVFNRVDGSNSRDVMDSFREITSNTGKNHFQEWKLAAFLSGQKDGEGMMNLYSEQGLKENAFAAKETFLGWASEDPGMAERWLDQLGPELASEKANLTKALMSGMAMHDPEAVIARLPTLDEEARLSYLPDVLFQVIQGEGLDRAIDWMLDAQQNTGPDDGTFASTLQSQVMDQTFFAARMRDGIPLLAERLIQINERMEISPQQISQSMNRIEPIEGLDLINRLHDSPMLADADAKSALLAQCMARLQNNPTALHDWLDENPSSPIRNEIAFIENLTPAVVPWQAE